MSIDRDDCQKQFFLMLDENVWPIPMYSAGALEDVYVSDELLD